ncbi:MAG: prmC [Burkholderiaceae bacterium]|nr:prmC [Burkholderiaceae bacterium]
MPLPEIVAGIRLGEVQRLMQGVLDPLDTRVLLSFSLGLSRVQLITQSERQLSSEEAERVRALLARRIAGEPVAYLVGEREFYGLSFHVTPDVLIPRPETELLVELALERLPSGGRVLDLGTGSGAIAVAIAADAAHAGPDVRVTAVDASAAALAVARGNAARLLSRQTVDFICSDWYAALPRGARFELIVSNPPYIEQNDAHLQQGDLRFEPADALTDHADGLSALRTIIAGAPQYLVPGGWLLMEHGYDQAEAVRALLVAQPFQQVRSWRDLAGLERVTGGMLHA